MRRSPALRWVKSLASLNPLPSGCVLYLPLWNPACWATTFQSIDLYGHTITRVGGVMDGDGDTIDGDDYISLPNGAGLTPETGTIMFWVNLEDATGTEVFYGSNINELKISRGATEGIFLHYDGAEEVNWTIAASLGTWVHFAFTFNKGGTCVGYEDAVQKGTTGISATAPTESTPTIGANSDKSSAWMKGKMREFGMWDYKMTLTEVTYHRNMTQR